MSLIVISVIISKSKFSFQKYPPTLDETDDEFETEFEDFLINKATCFMMFLFILTTGIVFKVYKQIRKILITIYSSIFDYVLFAYGKNRHF